jgi:hypothetical protein
MSYGRKMMVLVVFGVLNGFEPDYGFWMGFDRFNGLDEESLEDHSLVGIYQSLGNSMSFIRF